MLYVSLNNSYLWIYTRQEIESGSCKSDTKLLQ